MDTMRMVCWLLFIVGVGISAASSKVEYAKPWEKGVNMCAYIAGKGVMDHKICTYCLPWKQKLGKRMTEFVYDCCPGFVKTEAFGNKCVERERTWKLIPGILRDNKLPNFADLIVNKTTGAGFKEIDDMKSRKVFTVFAPYSEKTMNGMEFDYKSFKGKSVHPILFNVVRGRHYLNHLKNGMLLKTEYRQQRLKVTKYSNGMVCVECRILVEPDHEARNGIVHFFSGPLIPHDLPRIRRQSVMALLENDPRTEKFASSLPYDLRRRLAKSEDCNWYTVFAPTNDVWDALMAEFGELSEEIAKNHVLRRGMYCSAAIIAKIKKLGPTFADEHLQADCGNSGNRMLRGGCGSWSRITVPDLMAGNGVVHHINKPLMPLRAMTLAMFLSSNCLKGAKQWTDHLKSCDLMMTPGIKYAVLIPTEDAFQWWQNYPRFKKYYERFQNDARFRCRLIRFHIFQMSDEKATTLRHLWLQQEGYRTNNNDRQFEVDYFMRMYYGSNLHFHYSPVRDFRSHRFEGGSIFFIDRVNMIPEKYLTDILSSRPDFSITASLTNYTNMSTEVFQRSQPLNLFLVVRNGGYSKDMREKLKSKVFSKTNFLLLHYVQLYLWGGDIGYFENGTRHRFMSGVGTELIFDREKNGTMFIGHKGMAKSDWPRVVEWNLFAIDGMIWVLDKPLDCTEKCKRILTEKEIWKVMAFACWEALRSNGRLTSKRLDQFLGVSEGKRCYTFREIPKKETSFHEE